MRNVLQHYLNPMHVLCRVSCLCEFCGRPASYSKIKRMLKPYAKLYALVLG